MENYCEFKVIIIRSQAHESHDIIFSTTEGRERELLEAQAVVVKPGQPSNGSCGSMTINYI